MENRIKQKRMNNGGRSIFYDWTNFAVCSFLKHVKHTGRSQS